MFSKDFDFMRYFARKDVGSTEGSTILGIRDTLIPTHEELALTEVEIIDDRIIRIRSNESRYLYFVGGNQGVYKPGDGETCLYEAPEACHRLFQRERAVFLVSKLFNFNVIPPTVIRNVEGRLGSIQQVISDYTEADSGYTPDSYRGQLSLLALLDLITWNKDRKPEHKLASQNRVWGIDNGVSLDEWRGIYYLPNDLRKYVDDQPLPEIAVANIHYFNASREHQDGIYEILGDLIPSLAIQALLARTQALGNSLSRNQGRVSVNDLLDKRGSIEYHPR